MRLLLPIFLLLSFASRGQAVIANSPTAISPIGGTVSVCYLSTTTLTEGTTGGSWASSDNTIATIGTTGIVTGVNGGTCTISYTLNTNVATVVLAVNSSPITGATNQVCIGQTITLANATTGGVWASSTTTRATVTSATGVVTGVGIPTSTISYTVNSCVSTFPVTINSNPNAITGNTPMSLGSGPTTVSLSSTTGSGLWSSSNASIATVGSISVPQNATMGAVGIGTCTITYLVPSHGCFVTIVGTVNATVGYSGFKHTGWPPWIFPLILLASLFYSIKHIRMKHIATLLLSLISLSASAQITGLPAHSCGGTSYALGSLYPGGTWSSSNAVRMPINSITGVATAHGTGPITITHSYSDTAFSWPCYSVTAMTETATTIVYLPPSAILAPYTTVTDSSIIELDEHSAGAWSKNVDDSVSVFLPYGGTNIYYKAISDGAVTVTYTNLTTGCYTTLGLTNTH